MEDEFIDKDLFTILERLVIQMGPPQLLRLIAHIAAEHAATLLRQGAIRQAARSEREARILSRAADAIST